MVAPAPANGSRIEPALAAKALLVEQFLRPGSKRALDPLPDRNREPRLGSLEQRRRRLAVEQFAQDLLAAVGADLHRHRNARGKLGDTMVEERDARLEADCHCRAVDLAQ